VSRLYGAFLFVSAFMALAAPAFAEGEKGGAPSRPNIVFILTDDQRLEDIQHMPKLQQLLVGEGMSFDSYVDTVSLCCPSRTSILRGQYAHNTGVMTNGAQNGGFVTAHRLGVENSTVATWLHDAGYRTALIGKYLNHYPAGMGPTYIPPGWDYWASPVEGNPYSEYNYTLNENGKNVFYGTSADDYGTDVYTHHAVEFLKDCSAHNTPFFLYLAFYAPHAPSTPAPRHVGMFTDAKVVRNKAFNEADVAGKPEYIRDLPLMTEQQIVATDRFYGKRLRSLQAVDEAIETVYNTLKVAHKLDDTYIVFASDNGFHLGEHRMLRGKQTAYETDIHLPLIVRGPGIAHGAHAGELVANIDLAPTFADIAKAHPADFVDGRSLLPILDGKGGPNLKWRHAFLVEHWTMRGPQEADAGSVAGNGGSPSGGKASVSPQSPAIDAADDEPDEHAEAGGKNSMGTEQEPAKRAPRKQRSKRRRKQGTETARIPEFHALRTNGDTYVQYVTGEQEHYDLKDDPDQVDNGVKQGAQPSARVSMEEQRVEQLKHAAGASARALEDEPLVDARR
jgi:arylsulfatase A-like enzyme